MKGPEQRPEAKGKAEEKPSRKGRHVSTRDGPDASKNSVLNLQRTIGNQGVLSLLHSGAVQAKLRVSQPGDADEVEADRVAASIVSSPAAPTLHRKCACVGGGSSCPECESEEVEQGKGIHRKSSPHGSEVAESSEELLQALGTGQALDAGVRESMESGFGQDFGGVRIHTDRRAAESARALGARAFTFKSDIVFDSSEYSPGTESGKRLLAHELVHVGQQNANANYRSAAPVPTSHVREGVIQRDDKIPGWNFTPSDYAALVKAKKDLTLDSDSGWVPSKLQENILSTLRYTLDAKRTPSATEGINVQDFYHGHLVIPNEAKIPLKTSEKRTAFEEKKDEVEEKTLGKAGKVTKENLPDYTKALTGILPGYGGFLDEAVKIKGAAVIYHTFEFSTPSDLKKSGGNLEYGSPRRNYMTPLDTNVPKPYTPPDINNASSYSQDYTHVSQFAFLVGPDGKVHVRPGTTRQLSTVVGTPLD